MISTYTQILLDIMYDKNWKIRLIGIKVIEVMLIKFSEEFCSDTRIIKALEEKLSDKVFCVRKAMISTIRNVCKALGTAWSDKFGMSLFHSFIDNQNYLYRINFLQGLSEISKLISTPILIKELEFIIKLSKDPVPNIRYQSLITLLKVS